MKKIKGLCIKLFFVVGVAIPLLGDTWSLVVVGKKETVGVSTHSTSAAAHKAFKARLSVPENRAILREQGACLAVHRHEKKKGKEVTYEEAWDCGKEK